WRPRPGGVHARAGHRASLHRVRAGSNDVRPRRAAVGTDGVQGLESTRRLEQGVDNSVGGPLAPPPLARGGQDGRRGPRSARGCATPLLEYVLGDGPENAWAEGHEIALSLQQPRQWHAEGTRERADRREGGLRFSCFKLVDVLAGQTGPFGQGCLA